MFKHYLSLVKFSHTIFAMPFAVIGFFLGMSQVNSLPFYRIFILVILCMIFARTAAMAFNRYVDREFDSRNPRTASREIPAGIVSPKSALSLVFFSSLLFIFTTYFINPICFYLSPVAILVILGYSYTKRFTALCHLVLGVGLSLAPVGSYLAVTGFFSLEPIVLSFLVFTWVSAFDIIYSLQDDEFDSSQNLKSIPAFLGRKLALRLSEFLHALTASSVIFIGCYHNYGGYYCIGSALFIALLVFQHRLVKPNDLSRVNLAFGTTNGIAGLLYGIFYTLEIVIK